MSETFKIELMKKLLLVIMVLISNELLAQNVDSLKVSDYLVEQILMEKHAADSLQIKKPNKHLKKTFGYVEYYYRKKRRKKIYYYKDFLGDYSFSIETDKLFVLLGDDFGASHPYTSCVIYSKSNSEENVVFNFSDFVIIKSIDDFFEKLSKHEYSFMHDILWSEEEIRKFYGKD